MFRIQVSPDRLSRHIPPPPVRYAYHDCDVCGATFMAQLPEADHLRMYYESDAYHLDVHDDTKAPRSMHRGLSAFRRFHMGLARPLQGPPGRLLDYGCGPGDFMLYAKHLGWNTLGVEYSEESARTAKGRGLDVVLESRVDELPDESFDYISMIHSLEHVSEPTVTVSRLVRKLRPGGVLFVEVPYLDCHEFRLFGRHYSMIQAPVHLQFFTDATMRWLADKTGVTLARSRNNLWTPVHYVWSLLNVIEDATGLVIGRRQKGRLNAFAFPIVVVPAAITTVCGMTGVARQYWLRKA